MHFQLVATLAALALSTSLQPASATQQSSAPACAPSDPVVLMDAKSGEYVYAYDMARNPTGAGSVAPTITYPATLERTCLSHALHAGAKPAFDAMQLDVTKMIAAMSGVALTPAQHAKIEHIVHDALSQAIAESKAILTADQRARIDAVEKQMAFPGP